MSTTKEFVICSNGVIIKDRIVRLVEIEYDENIPILKAEIDDAVDEIAIKVMLHQNDKNNKPFVSYELMR